MSSHKIGPLSVLLPVLMLAMPAAQAQLAVFDVASVTQLIQQARTLAQQLEASRQQVRTDGVTVETMESLYLRSHDLKGLGTTYGYQLFTRIAGSLCRLIDEKDKRLTAPMALVDAHIDAIKAAVKGGIQTDTHPVGAALVSELEQRAKGFAAG